MLENQKKSYRIVDGDPEISMSLPIMTESELTIHKLFISYELSDGYDSQAMNIIMIIR